MQFGLPDPKPTHKISVLLQFLQLNPSSIFHDRTHEIYADRRSERRFLLSNSNTLSLELGKPDCVGVGLWLGLEVVYS